MKEESSIELIRNAAGGDTSAFRRLVEIHQRFVYAVAFRFVNDRADAEDITQEVFVKLWNNLNHYDGAVRLTTWLYRIVANACLDFLKSRNRMNMRSAEYAGNHREPADSQRPDEKLMQAEAGAWIRFCADALTPKQKAVFILRDLEGLEMNEVAEILSMSPGNIKSNLYYARMKLSELMNGLYAEQKKNVI